MPLPLAPRFLIVMGVSGCGKSTIAQMLAQRLGWDYYDADQFHPAANINKMANGIPLTDADRQPWLESLRKLISTCLAENRPGTLACSALKQRYRTILVQEDKDVGIIFLKGSFDLIWSRMSQRSDHYMKPNMLKSQFEALEEPKEAIVVGIERTPEEICDEVLSQLRD